MIEKTKWVLHPEPPDNLFGEFGDIPKLIVRALYRRGIQDAEGMRDYFINDQTHFPDPFLMQDMHIAVERILRAMRTGEEIAIYGDYDTDGVTATVLLLQFLAALGGRVRPYIPNRFDEGYGLNTAALDTLAMDGVRLVITVDCGARSIQEAEYAKQIGLDLVITDHHLAGESNPCVCAFLNPKRADCRYPDKNLAGVGVAFALLRALALSTPGTGIPNPENFLDLVAVGSVADMVPLVGENRALVRRGLDLINSDDISRLRPGLEALLQVAGVRKGNVNASSIGFQVGPRLNAAGRMETASCALRLLSTNDRQTAKECALELHHRNRERQELTRETVADAKGLLAQLYSEDKAALPGFLMVQKEGWNPGIIGLVASKIIDEYCRPIAVVTVEGCTARGSVRSIPGFHIAEALDTCKDLLERYGGHAAAAGFTIQTERLEELRIRLETLADTMLLPAHFRRTTLIDAEVEARDLHWDTWNWLQKMEPFGQGNPEPKFLAKGLRVLDVKTIGKEADHLKLRLAIGLMGFDAVAFGRGSDFQRVKNAGRMDMVFVLEENLYYGRKLQLRIVDMREGGRD